MDRSHADAIMGAFKMPPSVKELQSFAESKSGEVNSLSCFSLEDSSSKEFSKPVYADAIMAVFEALGQAYNATANLLELLASETKKNKMEEEND